MHGFVNEHKVIRMFVVVAFIWLRDPSFSNRMLPPYIGFSEEESRKCREVYERKYAQVP